MDHKIINACMKSSQTMANAWNKRTILFSCYGAQISSLFFFTNGPLSIPKTYEGGSEEWLDMLLVDFGLPSTSNIWSHSQDIKLPLKESSLRSQSQQCIWYSHVHVQWYMYIRVLPKFLILIPLAVCGWSLKNKLESPQPMPSSACPMKWQQFLAKFSKPCSPVQCLVQKVRQGMKNCENFTREGKKTWYYRKAENFHWIKISPKPAILTLTLQQYSVDIFSPML